MASSEITLEAVPSVAEVPAEDWNACANPGASIGRDGLAGSCATAKTAYNPFVSHAFFSALETSGSATPRTGWGARHLVAKLGGRIAGIVPCYLKSH